MLDSIKETDRLESIFLEVLDDISKKELILYLLCYIQLVRKLGNVNIPLDQFLRCASRNFISMRNSWKDVLTEMNIFFINDLYGNIYTGKDIYRVDEKGFYFISIDHKYCRDLSSFSSKVAKYWGVVNKLSHYGRSMTPYDAVYVSAIMFNEGLYDELLSYCEFQKERFRKEADFFDALSSLSLAYRKKKDAVEYINQCLKKIAPLGDVYYSINLEKLKKDLSKLLKKLQKGKSLENIKIEFVNGEKNKESTWRKLIKSIRNFFKRMKGGKRWTLTISETAYYYSIEDCSKKRKNFLTES